MHISLINKCTLQHNPINPPTLFPHRLNPPFQYTLLLGRLQEARSSPSHWSCLHDNHPIVPHATPTTMMLDEDDTLPLPVFGSGSGRAETGAIPGANHGKEPPLETTTTTTTTKSVIPLVPLSALFSPIAVGKVEGGGGDDGTELDASGPGPELGTSALGRGLGPGLEPGLGQGPNQGSTDTVGMVPLPSSSASAIDRTALRTLRVMMGSFASSESNSSPETLLSSSPSSPSSSSSSSPTSPLSPSSLSASRKGLPSTTLSPSSHQHIHTHSHHLNSPPSRNPNVLAGFDNEEAEEEEEEEGERQKGSSSQIKNSPFHHLSGGGDSGGGVIGGGVGSELDNMNGVTYDVDDDDNELDNSEDVDDLIAVFESNGHHSPSITTTKNNTNTPSIPRYVHPSQTSQSNLTAPPSQMDQSQETLYSEESILPQDPPQSSGIGRTESMITMNSLSSIDSPRQIAQSNHTAPSQISQSNHTAPSQEISLRSSPVHLLSPYNQPSQQLSQQLSPQSPQPTPSQPSSSPSTSSPVSMQPSSRLPHRLLTAQDFIPPPLNATDNGTSTSTGNGAVINDTSTGAGAGAGADHVTEMGKGFITEAVIGTGTTLTTETETRIEKKEELTTMIGGVTTDLPSASTDPPPIVKPTPRPSKLPAYVGLGGKSPRKPQPPPPPPPQLTQQALQSRQIPIPTIPPRFSLKPPAGVGVGLGLDKSNGSAQKQGLTSPLRSSSHTLVRSPLTTRSQPTSIPTPTSTSGVKTTVGAGVGAFTPTSAHPQGAHFGPSLRAILAQRSTPTTPTTPTKSIPTPTKPTTPSTPKTTPSTPKITPQMTSNNNTQNIPQYTKEKPLSLSAGGISNLRQFLRKSNVAMTTNTPITGGGTPTVGAGAGDAGGAGAVVGANMNTGTAKASSMTSSPSTSTNSKGHTAVGGGTPTSSTP